MRHVISSAPRSLGREARRIGSRLARPAFTVRAFVAALSLVVLLGAAALVLAPRATVGTVGSLDRSKSAPRLAALAGPAQPPGLPHSERLDFQPLLPRNAPTAVDHSALPTRPLPSVTPVSLRPRGPTGADEARAIVASRTGTAAAARAPRPVPLVSRVVRYRVRPGDSVAGIARRFHLRPATLRWSNLSLFSGPLRIGRTLLVPPVDGVAYVAGKGDTLHSVTRAYRAPLNVAVEANGLRSTARLRAGQVVLVLHGRGLPVGMHIVRPQPRPAVPPAPSLQPRPVVRPTPRVVVPLAPRATTRPAPTPRPTAAPTPAPTPRPATPPPAPTSCSCGMRWPVAGGSISRGFSGYHQGLDIYAPTGTAVLAARSGQVVFAGWRGNGGGYQVWINHGGGTSTTYNHMSAVTVGTGASVGAGQLVGRVGQTGVATGPHLHFEVWIGPIWSGGYRVNPLRYL